MKCPAVGEPAPCQSPDRSLRELGWVQSVQNPRLERLFHEGERALLGDEVRRPMQAVEPGEERERDSGVAPDGW